MKKQPTPVDLGLAAQLLYGPVAEQASNCNLADSHLKVNPDPTHDARAMAALLQNMQSGMDAYVAVWQALRDRHGRPFLDAFYAEVQNG